MARNGNSTKAAKRLQLQETCDLIMNGHTRADILEHFKNKWKLKRAAADLIIAQANQRLAEINEGAIEQSQALVLQGLFKQYRALDAAKEHAAAAKVLVEIAKLKGLDSSTIHLKIDRPAQEMTDEELAEALGAK